MTTEMESELIQAFNSGYVVPTAEPSPTTEPTPLDRLRMEWSKATDDERAVFKAEIHQCLAPLDRRNG